MTLPASTTKKRVDYVAREALHRVRGVLRRETLVDAWNLLQERDENGNARGALPWTDEAIEALEKARKSFPNDPSVMHHLAVARHARAWDYELSDDQGLRNQARSEWEVALGYWYELAASPGFWKQQEEKLKRCREEADPTALKEARSNLVTDLLDIHVEFVRHYCELGDVDRAGSHIEIVRHANIRPAAKKVLKTNIFKAVTSAVQQAKAAGEFRAALRPIELFMKLFPDPYLPALEMYAGICSSWMGRLSYEHDWDEIVEVANRAEPIAKKLAASDELIGCATARNAFEELTSAVMLRANDRAQSYHAAAKENDDALPALDKAQEYYQFAIRWGRLGFPKSRDGTIVLKLLPSCLNNYAFCLHSRLVRVFKDSSNPLLVMDEVQQQCAVAVEAMEEAVRYKPEDSTFQRNLSQLRDQQQQLEMMF